VDSGDIDILKGLEHPVLAIFLELGVEPHRQALSHLQVIQHPRRPPCYSFTLQEAGHETFAVLKNKASALHGTESFHSPGEV
jgi:hypothetical protein